MGLDKAVYDPTTGKIFGCRSQWIYQFNATTGALEATVRAAPSTIAPSSITVIGANLYLGVRNCWQQLPIDNADFANPNKLNNVDIFRVTASGLVAQGGLGLPLIDQGGGTLGDDEEQGYLSLVNNGSSLFFWGAFTGIVNITNPLVPVGNYHRWSVQFAQDMVYDSTHSALWICDSSAPNVWVYSPTWYSDFLDTFNNGFIHPLYGLDYSSQFNKTYIVTGGATLYMVPPSEMALIFPLTNSYQFNLTTLSTGIINSVPIRCKACPYLGHPFTGKLLIPTWSGDSVLVWDMASDDAGQMVVKSGFSSPIDIVYTPSKAFAVQTSTVGLKEVTP